jgi:ubiquinone/menaquinone biosynthesis C-methylase UbiE
LNYRVKLLAFLLCALVVFFIFNVGYSALNTISRLNAVEAARDQWQRPFDVVRALDLRPGNVVADLGCGSGYFTLRLSSPVGPSGRVIAEDIRRLPLVFLWSRTILKRNVTIIRGEPDDPHLPVRVDAVLIANTYHEFADAQSILAHVSQSLIARARLVVVDRAPKPDGVGAKELAVHEVSAERVESELLQAHFEIVSREDHFIEKDPDNETWWLIVARKP